MAKGIVNETELGSLAEPLQKEYVKGEDGRFYLKVEEVDGWAFENVTGLKQTVRSERERREEWERKHSELAKTVQGVDPSDIKNLPTLKAELERMKKWTPEEKVAERIRAHEEEYGRKLTASEELRLRENAEKDARIKSLIVGSQSSKYLAKLKCIDSTLHEAQIMSVTRTDDKGGIYVVGADGEPLTTKKPGAVGNMGLEEYCEMLRKTYPQNFKGSESTGGGGDPTGAGGAGGSKGTNLAGLPPEERLKALRRSQA